jgi:hypothetical protein
MKMWTTAIAAGFAMALSAASAQAAALVGTFEGNDCAGVFGQGFENCVIPEDIDPDQTPIVAKFDFSKAGVVTETTVNTALYPSLDGSEWTFDLDAGTWTYDPGPDDPVITFFVAKGGPSFNLYSLHDDELTGEMFGTPINPRNGKPYGLSHLSFYDTDGDTPPDNAPEPAMMALLGFGLIGAGYARRRRR